MIIWNTKNIEINQVNIDSCVMLYVILQFIAQTPNELTDGQLMINC